MTINARHARVRGLLVGRELGIHYRVAQLAAKLDRISEFVSPVTSCRADHDEHHAERHYPGNGAPLPGVVEVQPWESGNYTGSFPPAPPPLEQHAQRD